ncbi:hypothetical protein HPB50_019686 [Hyalomma asiaticum]|uniref:Uncharacterized protein n=1 Tax=Hyalomma asiaticum TaxID=266040 RepID=A0ACB7TN78_HYAAI|nr:hypothetical protein HPB50_019686 [Hyalomma asiaticum]
MSRNSGDESGATNGEGASAREDQSDAPFGGLTPERRLQELRVEMERLSQMMSGSSQRSMPEFGRRDPCSELRRYSKDLKAEAPVWFESVESALEAYEIPREFWGLLVFPLIAERVPYLSTRLSPAQHRDYSVIKETVLDELKLSVGEYLKRFLGSEKRENEGWRPFATRLQSYLHFYLGAREVSTFEALVELLVADQLKRNLSEEARRYVTLQEGRKWMNAPEITTFLRTFEEAQGANSAAKQVRQRAAESPSAIPPETVQPRGTVNLTSAFGERVEAKLAVIPLAMSREGAVGTDVQDAVPVLCALTDRLTEKNDCLLSERAWNLLNEQRAFHGVVKDAAGVGNPQLRREGGSSNPGAVQQHHGEEHAAEEEAPAECSAVGPAATQSVVQECCGTDIVVQNRCSESLHENLEWRDKIKNEDASLVEMLARDRRRADNRCTGGAGTPVVGQGEIGPQRGFTPSSVRESAQLVVEGEQDNFELEKYQVARSVVRYSGYGASTVKVVADPRRFADRAERTAPGAEAQCRGMPEFRSHEVSLDPKPS